MAVVRATRFVAFSRWRFTPARVAAACALLLALAVGVVAVQFSRADNLVLPSGAVVGGDYVAFHAAAKAAAAGDAAATYDAERFAALLKQYGPPKDHIDLTWQYPPTYFLILLPFALLGYLPGYILWTGGTLAAHLATLRGAGFKPFFLFVVVASPAAFHAATTGQNGFASAALLAAAALYPDRRPIVAGIAAALLTVKPQLGLLVPIAYAAGGCWRAFGVASLGAILLAAASVLLFGFATWAAFFDGLAGAGENLAAGLLPLYKMATPYAAARFAGVPNAPALAVHALFALAAAGAVGLVWRRVREADLRAAILIAGVFLAAPYGFYYELIILALPAALLARRALDQGWLRGEQAAITLIFILPLFLPGEAQRRGASLGLLIVLLAAACVVRRIAQEHPNAFVMRAAWFSWPRRAFLRRDSQARRRRARLG